ncbi:FadR/GntR family transcriptional regulator [Microbacterium trichothecenolyticum]|uniref:DNA-binding FadR family transcriptional regulator n=1 Tax=Microbacterium trichothecenolyticum TaxID=69370 RepID=A0ABU0TS28_MICTR|nr:FCD domain-containing protein [Microbacterium trichothecenolyticum]MDQ1122444.1 DNA-binding FadR family transcriptional regulator [Microbacterium trichothecenolyticum]
MTSVRRESLADQAAAVLYARIRDGEWTIGDRLPSETALAPQLDVGRSTVREAIRQLAGRGILTTRQGAGVFVSALSDRPRAFDRADVAAVLEARSAIEIESAALAAERRTDAQLAGLRHRLGQRAAHRDDVTTHVDTDMALHRSIVEAADSPVLLELFDQFAPRSRAAMLDMLAARGHHGSEADQEAHERIVDAIDARDAASAAALTRSHLVELRVLLDANAAGPARVSDREPPAPPARRP